MAGWSRAAKEDDETMAKTQDFTAVMKDMMGAFPVDASAFEDAFKTTATLNEKLSAVCLEAADKSAEISSKWTKDTIDSLFKLQKVDFFWINRDHTSFEWFVNLLSQLEIEQQEQACHMSRLKFLLTIFIFMKIT